MKLSLLHRQSAKGTICRVLLKELEAGLYDKRNKRDLRQEQIGKVGGVFFWRNNANLRSQISVNNYNCVNLFFFYGIQSTPFGYGEGVSSVEPKSVPKRGKLRIFFSIAFLSPSESHCKPRVSPYWSWPLDQFISTQWISLAVDGMTRPKFPPEIRIMVWFSQFSSLCLPHMFLL